MENDEIPLRSKRAIHGRLLTVSAGSGSDRDVVSFSQRVVQFSQFRTSDGGAEHSVCKASYLTYGF